MKVQVELPEGFAGIAVQDFGMGPCLVVRMANGRQVLLDALHLTDHECQVGVVEGEDAGDLGEVVGSLSFSAMGPVVAWPQVQPQVRA